MPDRVDVDPFPHPERWLDAVGQRSATLNAYELAKSYNKNAVPPSSRAQKRLGFLALQGQRLGVNQGLFSRR